MSNPPNETARAPRMTRAQANLVGQIGAVVPGLWWGSSVGAHHVSLRALLFRAPGFIERKIDAGGHEVWRIKNG